MTEADQLKHYFEVCGYRPDDTISIVTRAAADGPLYWTFVPVADAPKQIVARSRVNCWFSANPMHKPDDRESRGTAADVYAVRALWADLDVKPGGMPSNGGAKSVMKKLSDLLGAKPVAIVRSGHGYQPRWKLATDGVGPAELAPVIERFGRLVQDVAAELGGKADSVYDLPRIIRAPFTMNIKPELEPVATNVWIYDHGESVSFAKLLEVLDAHQPTPPKTASANPENRHVGIERGNAYTKGALEYIRNELFGIADWPSGKTDDRGRGWEKIQADAALRLASLAKADWNGLPLERAKEFFVAWSPIGGGWTERDVIKKWNSQVKRAEPADPPADTDDPLAGGGLPHPSAAREAAIWIEGDDRAAGQDGGSPEVLAQRAVGEEDPAGRPAPEGLTWRKFQWSDVGNADRLVFRYGEELRYVESLDRWFRYSDGAWRESKLGGQTAAMELLREVYRLESELYSDEEYRKGRTVTSDRVEFGKWWESQLSTTRIKAAAEATKFDGRITVRADEFDAHEMLLNATNGVIDLQTGELLEHHPRLMLRRQIPVAYVPEAEASRWEKYLDRVMPSPDMRNYLQRIVGYSLTGDTSEQAVFLHYGVTHNGKSVFLRVLESLLGELSRVVPPTTLLTKKAESHPTDIMGLEGRRMLQVSELPEGARLDEALLKRLSGEETITARGMGQDFRDFRITGKIHMVTNPLPHISDDRATHRRLHLIKWGVTIPEEERDPKLAARIIAEELEGVLAWAVRGALAWRESGLKRPVEAEIDRAEYIGSEDEFGEFMEEELVIGAESFTTTKDLYRRYAQYCDGLRMKPMSKIAFGRKLSARGIEAARGIVSGRQQRGFKVALSAASWARQDPLG